MNSQRMKITYLAAMSLDGFIARENGDVSWLDELNISMSESGLEAFFKSVDGLVMGRATYDFVFHYGSWPYEDKPTWVCTHRDLEPLKGANLIIVSEIEEVIRQATSQGLKHLWLLGGGKLASSFLSQGLLTHLSLSEMPVQLGSGIPLFANHNLDQIPYVEREIIDKIKFRQIEYTLREGG
jgi:dihydrofolate reductase